VRDYLHRHAFGNATWDDLIAALARRTPVDLRQWSRMWIEEAGRPLIRTDLTLRDGRVERLSIGQSDPQARGRLWPQQLRVTLGCGEGRTDARRRPRRQRRRPDFAPWRLCPRLCARRRRRLGIWGVRIRSRTQVHLLTALHRIDDPLARGVAWSALWDAMLSARLAPDRLFDTAVQTLEREADPQLVGEMLGDLQTLWWKFLAPAQRATRAAALEQFLRRQLDAATTRD
jgi:aminopeptidase N